jgi:hypothetical protein
VLDLHYRRYLIVLALLMATPAWATTPSIMGGAASQYAASNTCNTTATVSSVNAPAGAELMTVIIAIEGGENVTGVTWNGAAEALSLGVDSGARSGNTDVRVMIWTLISPSDVTDDVVVTCNTGNLNPMMIYVAFWNDVDTNPGDETGDTDTAFNESGTTSCVMTGNPGASGNMLLSVGAFQGSDIDPIGIIPSSAWTTVTTDSVGNASNGMSLMIASEPSPPNTATFSNLSIADENACAILELCEVGGCAVGGGTRNRFKLISYLWGRLTWWV